MEDKLLDLVVKNEMKELEDKRKLILETIHQNNETLKELKNSFLTEIMNCSNLLISNSQLLNKLEDIKLKINSSSIELETSIKSLSKINQLREVYKPLSKKGALFYMILYQLKEIDPLYQFSIDSFIKLFYNSINTAKKNQIELNRISNIIDQLTNLFFEFSCISIYEKHNILFIFQLACTLDKDSGKLLDSEIIFFIKGGFEKSSIKNPITWLSNSSWQDIVYLSMNFDNFSNLIEHVCSNNEDWKKVNLFLDINLF